MNTENTNNEIKEVKDKPKSSIKAILSSDAMRKQLAIALPRHMDVDRFIRIALTALNNNPKLLLCTQESLFKCLLDLSAYGLEPDGRHAHLIPYKSACTLLIDYKGFVSLVRRTGDVSTIHADIVCKNDKFMHNMGQVEVHSFDLDQDRGDIIGSYCVATMKDGDKQAVVLTKQEIDKIRDNTPFANDTSSPWRNFYAEMAKKTAFKRLCKWLELSPELIDAIKTDESYEKAMRDITPKRNMDIQPLKFEIEDDLKKEDNENTKI